MYSKCMPVFVKDMAAGIASYEALGLKCTGQHENTDGGMIQSIFPLAGGGIIELIAPLDDSDSENAIVQALATRGEGMNHLSLDGSAGAVDALNAAGVRTICMRNPPLITRDLPHRYELALRRRGPDAHVDSPQDDQGAAAAQPRGHGHR